jgi:hypothetical protein
MLRRRAPDYVCIPESASTVTAAQSPATAPAQNYNGRRRPRPIVLGIGAASLVVASSLSFVPPRLVHATATYGMPTAGYSWVISNGQGEPEVFVTGQDQHAYHAWCCWTGWSQLPGPSLKPGLTAAEDADGRMEVFGVGTSGDMYHAWQTCINCGWATFASLGSIGGGFNNQMVKVGRNLDGRLEIFAVANDCHMYHAWQVAANSYWSQWTSLGGCWSSGLTVGRNSDGRLEVFAVGQNGSLYHGWQTSAGGGWDVWGFLGGAWGDGCTSDGCGDSTGCDPIPDQAIPGVAMNRSGELEAQVPQYDSGCGSSAPGEVWHRTQTCAGCNYTNWNLLGGSFGCAYNNPKPFAWPNDKLETFEGADVQCDASEYHTWETCTTCWSGWYGISGAGDGADAPAGLDDASGNLEVFYINGNGGDVEHIWWTGSYWTGLQSLGGNWPEF